MSQLESQQSIGSPGLKPRILSGPVADGYNDSFTKQCQEGKAENPSLVDVKTTTMQERFALVRAQIPPQWVQPESAFWESASAAAEAVGGRLTMSLQCGGSLNEKGVAAVLSLCGPRCKNVAKLACSLATASGVAVQVEFVAIQTPDPRSESVMVPMALDPSLETHRQSLCLHRKSIRQPQTPGPDAGKERTYKSSVDWFDRGDDVHRVSSDIIDMKVSFFII